MLGFVRFSGSGRVVAKGKVWSGSPVAVERWSEQQGRRTIPVLFLHLTFVRRLSDGRDTKFY